MPPNVTGPGAAGGVPIPPTAPVRPATPSRALVPVERVGPRAAPESPLGRSGVALPDLLFATDLLETREAVAPVAMEVGLETARRQLLQRMAADSLESLDGVWSRAAGTEEGWYLRAGALTVLGHPHEGDRIAGEGLAAQPQSLALRLLQSVSRALVGDLSGARAALYPALDAAPDDPVLLAQQAVVLARQGHADDASELLQRLASTVPDHPALAWARTAVRTATTDRTRSAARATPDDASPFPDTVEAVDAGVPDDDHGDMVASAFRTLGAALGVQHDDVLENGARTLLRACSAGGTLASASTPAEAHAARQLLSALLIALRNEAGGSRGDVGQEPLPVTPLMNQLLPLLRTQRGVSNVDVAVDADRLMRRFSGAVPAEMRRLLGHLIDGATGGGTARAADRGDTEIGTFAADDADLGPLVPVRLGLSLLAETSATRALERRQEVLGAPVTPSGGATVVDGATFVPSPALQAARGDGEPSGLGWGGARAAAEQNGRQPASAGNGAAFPVILLVAGALGAAMNGAGLIAALLGGAGLWLALRSRGQSP